MAALSAVRSLRQQASDSVVESVISLDGETTSSSTPAVEEDELSAASPPRSAPVTQKAMEQEGAAVEDAPSRSVTPRKSVRDPMSISRAKSPGGVSPKKKKMGGKSPGLFGKKCGPPKSPPKRGSAGGKPGPFGSAGATSPAGDGHATKAPSKARVSSPAPARMSSPPKSPSRGGGAVAWGPPPDTYPHSLGRPDVLDCLEGDVPEMSLACRKAGELERAAIFMEGGGKHEAAVAAREAAAEMRKQDESGLEDKAKLQDLLRAYWNAASAGLVVTHWDEFHDRAEDDTELAALDEPCM